MYHIVSLTTKLAMSFVHECNTDSSVWIINKWMYGIYYPPSLKKCFLGTTCKVMYLASSINTSSTQWRRVTKALNIKKNLESDKDVHHDISKGGGRWSSPFLFGILHPSILLVYASVLLTLYFMVYVLTSRSVKIIILLRFQWLSPYQVFEVILTLSRRIT